MGHDVNVYEQVTDRVLARLDQGTAPWRQPWRVRLGPPKSLATGKPYRGINVLLLGLEDFASPYWATFQQIKELGGHVRQGEKSTMVVLWRRIKVADKATGEDKTIPLLRYFHVFNLEQAEGLAKVPADAFPEARSFTAEQRHANAEAIVAGYPHAPVIKEVGTRAVYWPGTDEIHVPQRTSFGSLDEFYSTLFHELGHSTGHADRLKRTFGQTFGDHAYGREELVAEMVSAFLQAEAGIEVAEENSAAYLDSWRKTIAEDVNAVVVAAGAAQRAVDLILGRSFATESGQDQPAAAALASVA